MSGSGGSAFARSHGEDRFYNPPAIRRQRQQLLEQQQQLQNHTKAVEAENRAESDESTSSKPSVCSSPPPPPSRQENFTNLDRFLESTTPVVPAQYFSKTSMRGWRSCNSEFHPYFSLGDLWESFKEWSAYGAGVPLVLNESDCVVQYYVPSLSGIQLYIDPSKASKPSLRRPGEASDTESSRETSSDCSSDCEADRQAQHVSEGLWNQQNLMDLNAQRMNRITLRDQPFMSLRDEGEVSNLPGLLIFEYLEQNSPYNREPLADKISVLASRFPKLRTYRSCDLLPASWISVAWYPIYRIPTGPTLQDLDSCFLTFHSLSTPFRNSDNYHLQLHGSGVGKANGAPDMSAKLSLPIFGLASYKFKGSVWTPNGAYERQQASSLLQAADNWLQLLRVDHPDYRFFVSHNTSWR